MKQRHTILACVPFLGISRSVSPLFLLPSHLYSSFYGISQRQYATLPAPTTAPNTTS